jgi:hypothetical protein
MDERDPNELSEALEQEADKLERQGEEVKHAVNDAREDWEHKRRDQNVPGAIPPEPGETDEPGQADDA